MHTPCSSRSSRETATARGADDDGLSGRGNKFTFTRHSSRTAAAAAAAADAIIT